MRFTCTISNEETGNTWEEKFDKPHVNSQAEAEEWARDTIAMFNATLRENEKPRTLLMVKLDGESEVHDWHKTNMVTVIRGGELYDTYRCSRCGATGKRFGLSHNIVIDKKFAKQTLCRSGR